MKIKQYILPQGRLFALLMTTAYLVQGTPVLAQSGPVSPNVNWQARLNGGGAPTNPAPTRAGMAMKAISKWPGLSQGNMEQDRRAVEQWKRQQELESLQNKLRAEQERRAAAEAARCPTLPREAGMDPDQSPSVMPNLHPTKEQIEEAARWHLRSQLNGNHPTMGPNTTPVWIQQQWMQNQHLLRGADE